MEKESADFCAVCPRKGDCNSTAVEAKSHDVDAAFFSMSDEALGLDISLGTFFYDEEGNKSEYFPPDTTLDDLKICDGIETDYRYGFLWLKRRRDCGAMIASIHRFRESIWGSKKPPE